MAEKFCSVLSSPVGTITIYGDDAFVHTVTFSDQDPGELIPNAVTEFAARELQDYFDGKLREFSFPIAQKGTDFQKEVWSNLLKIPYGTTTSYAKFSAHQPLAIRAIASANGKNNIAIAVPCHRVIGSSGKLVGYAGGLWRKKWLLQHESEVMQTGQTELKF